jgi:hypothetical protein
MFYVSARMEHGAGGLVDMLTMSRGRTGGTLGRSCTIIIVVWLGGVNDINRGCTRGSAVGSAWWHDVVGDIAGGVGGCLRGRHMHVGG